MKDEYLWDKSGAADSEVDGRGIERSEIERMESLLARYRYTGVTPELPATQRAHPFRTAVLAAAGLAAVLLIAWRFAHRELAGYRVLGVDGETLVRAGEELSTGALEFVRLQIGWLGQVDVEPNSRLRVDDCGGTAHRLYLARGAVKARIFAEPRLFQIDTPAGLTVDLGCAYTLEVDADGRSELSVTDGQVAFEFDGREVYVPQGAACTSAPGRGPTAPLFAEASAAFKSAVAEVEFSADPDPASVERMLDIAEREDTLTLWHLFDAGTTAPSLQRAIYARLAKMFSMPAGVTEAGILAGDRSMRAQWMESMKPAWRVR